MSRPPFPPFTAETASIDEVSNTDRCCRAASACSCVHKLVIVSRDGSAEGARLRASSRSACHSCRNVGTSSGGVLIDSASLDDVLSRPSRI